MNSDVDTIALGAAAILPPPLPDPTTEECAELLATATRLPHDIAAMLIDPTWRDA
jgi:hypothetical protein